MEGLEGGPVSDTNRGFAAEAPELRFEREISAESNSAIGVGRSSEPEQVDRLVGSETWQTSAAQSESQPLVDESRDPFVLERDEGADPKLSDDGVCFPGIAADEVRQCDGFGHADRFRRKEPLQGEEILGIRRIRLDGPFDEHPAHELGLRDIGVHSIHRWSARTTQED